MMAIFSQPLREGKRNPLARNLPSETIDEVRPEG